MGGRATDHERREVPSRGIGFQRAYERFNARDIDGVLATMQPDVEWPNGMESGTVHGHNACAYWTRQWGMLNPRLDPVSFHDAGQGKIVVGVHQVVHDLSGNLLLDRQVEHVYSLKGGLICRMEIRE